MMFQVYKSFLEYRFLNISRTFYTLGIYAANVLQYLFSHIAENISDVVDSFLLRLLFNVKKGGLCHPSLMYQHLGRIFVIKISLT